MPIDLTGEITAAIDGAMLRGHTLALGYTDDDGYPAASFRGSTYVYSPTQLAVWVRNAKDGLALSIPERPKVTLAFIEPDGPGAMFLSIRGHGTIDPSKNDEVYAAIIEAERGRDPEQGGVALIIDVVSVRAMGAAGFYAQSV